MTMERKNFAKSHSAKSLKYKSFNKTGLSVFSKGIGQSATPVNKKFAPIFATAHSLKANQCMLVAENSVRGTKKRILQNLVPEQKNILDDTNKLIDSTMSKVIEKINLKRDLEKKQRELRERLQKRTDEVNSLFLLENKISTEMG